MIGPSATPTPAVAVQIAIAFGRSFAGNTLEMIDNVAGMISAAPTPITARLAISCSDELTIAETAEPTQEEVNARLTEIRKELPACVRENCASDDGWKAFLAAHDLAPERVSGYIAYRLEILKFIEERFRPGIHISPQDIETYYRNTLLPEYGPGEAVPSLEKVSPRIEEILLQQQVNLLFDEWLKNLRKQGDIEVLDPSLESAETPGTTPDNQIGAASGKGEGGQ